MHRMGSPQPLPSFYSQPVQPLFDKWLAKFLDVQNKANYRIPDPFKEKKVHAYLERLRSILIEQKERRTIWWHSLRSFPDFLRETARRRIEDLGELDVIFPEDMTIYFDTIIRKVPITTLSFLDTIRVSKSLAISASVNTIGNAATIFNIS